MNAKGYGISFVGGENVLKVIMVMVTQLWKYTLKSPRQYTVNW